jgi:pro-apoptotic serine protease NMA111
MSAGDNTPEVELDLQDYDAESEIDSSSRLQQSMLIPAADPEWQNTIKNVVRNVVSIRFCQTTSFDTDPALTSEATGFVVDAEKGYVEDTRNLWHHQRS